MALDGAEPRVLIIDDQIFILEALVFQLEAESIPCAKCESGYDAIKLLHELIKQDKPLFDVILTDFSMPGMSGPDTAIRIRAIYEEVGRG